MHVCVCASPRACMCVACVHAQTHTCTLCLRTDACVCRTAVVQFVNYMHCDTEPQTVTKAKELLSFMELVQTDSWPRCSGSGGKMSAGGNRDRDRAVGSGPTGCSM